MDTDDTKQSQPQTDEISEQEVNKFITETEELQHETGVLIQKTKEAREKLKAIESSIESEVKDLEKLEEETIDSMIDTTSSTINSIKELEKEE